jgi:hypothetical protein
MRVDATVILHRHVVYYQLKFLVGIHINTGMDRVVSQPDIQ